MKTDYPELENTKIKFKYAKGPRREFDAIVIGASYHVGITVVDAKDKTNKLICLTRKDHSCGNWTPETYRKMFYKLVEMIREGLVDQAVLYDTDPYMAGWRHSNFRTGSMAECAFL